MIGKYGSFETPLTERYRFDVELGRGAMGKVYLANDMRLGRPVAIKMLHPALTNELGVKRFQSEILIAAGLHHPGIIGIHDCGEADGHLYYVMEYLGGESLRTRLARDGQLPLPEAVSIMRQIADALYYAHERGIVHRDVKPENILLAEGRACLVDFGLARIINDSGSVRLTESGMTVGTPQYLSPEQAGAERDVGPHSDQYALACVLYEMLVGEPPFSGPTATAIAWRHIRDTPPPLRSRRPDTPLAVESAVTRGLSKLPSQRFPTVKAFSSASGYSMVTDREAATPLHSRSTFRSFVIKWTKALTRGRINERDRD